VVSPTCKQPGFSASPAELPELNDFLSAFQVRFRRPEGPGAV
jgi:hypothetical protein